MWSSARNSGLGTSSYSVIAAASNTAICMSSIFWDRPWWRHQMKTLSSLLAICVENSPVTGEFPAQRPVTRSFDVFFDMRLNKPLNKQWWGCWFETLSRPLWRHCNAMAELIQFPIIVAMFSLRCLQQFKWAKLFYCLLAIRLYHVYLFPPICHFDAIFFGFADFRQPQMLNAHTK